MRRLVLGLVVACSSEHQTATPTLAAPRVPAVVAALDASVDAHVVHTLGDALARLRERGYAAAADVIDRRVAQTKPKMRLTSEQALAAATALLELDRAALRELHAVMPRSTVELA